MEVIERGFDPSPFLIGHDNHTAVIWIPERSVAPWQSRSFGIRSDDVERFKVNHAMDGVASVEVQGSNWFDSAASGRCCKVSPEGAATISSENVRGYQSQLFEWERFQFG